MPLTVFETRGIRGTRRERIEAAVQAGGKHTKTVNCGINAALEVDESILRPKAAAQFFARNDAARALQERTKDLPRLRLKTDTNTLLTELSGLQIHFERTELDESGRESGFRIRVGRRRHGKIPFGWIVYQARGYTAQA